MLADLAFGSGARRAAIFLAWGRFFAGRVAGMSVEKCEVLSRRTTSTYPPIGGYARANCTRHKPADRGFDVKSPTESAKATKLASLPAGADCSRLKMLGLLRAFALWMIKARCGRSRRASRPCTFWNGSSSRKSTTCKNRKGAPVVKPPCARLLFQPLSKPACRHAATICSYLRLAMSGSAATRSGSPLA
jgi:hypothetical protein